MERREESSEVRGVERGEEDRRRGRGKWDGNDLGGVTVGCQKIKMSGKCVCQITATVHTNVCVQSHSNCAGVVSRRAVVFGCAAWSHYRYLNPSNGTLSLSLSLSHHWRKGAGGRARCFGRAEGGGTAEGRRRKGAATRIAMPARLGRLWRRLVHVCSICDTEWTRWTPRTPASHRRHTGHPSDTGVTAVLRTSTSQ